jgi:membrane protein implicated in regulation of membrane protease activity
MPAPPRRPSGLRFAAVAMALFALGGVALIVIGNATGRVWLMLVGALALGLAPLWLLRPLMRGGTPPSDEGRP